MPTVEDLDRLQGIVSRLVPLAETRRGELIRADDWNTIVAALLELARAVLAEERDETAPTHSHDDQVQLSWLDARLRSLLQEGPLGDPRNVARLAAIERRLDRADGDLGDVRESVGTLRERVGDVATRDVVRESDLTSVRRSIDAINDSRRDVLTLRTSLDAIRADVQRAIELADGLVVDGEPVDVADVVRRLTSVEELRTRLTRADGELLDAAAFEHRLAEFAATLVTAEQLEATLKKMRPRVSEEQVSAIRQDVLAAASAQTESSITSLRGELEGSIERRLSDVDSRIASGVSAAVPGIRDEVLAASRTMLDEGMRRAAAETAEVLDRRLAEAAARTDRTIQEHVGSVRDEAIAAAREHAEALVREAVQPLDERVTKLGSWTESTAAAVDELRSHVGALGDRVVEFVRRLAAVPDETLSRAKEMTYEIVRSEVSALNDRLEGLVKDAVARQMESVRGEMTEIARAEVQNVRDEMRKMIPAYVERAFSTLPDRFARDFEERGPLYEVMARMVDERMQR